MITFPLRQPTLAERIAVLTDEAGSINSLASKAGLSRETVSHARSGSSLMHTSLSSLAQAADCAPYVSCYKESGRLVPITLDSDMLYLGAQPPGYFADAIVAGLQRIDRSKKEFAFRLGISVQSVSPYLNGHNLPATRLISQYAAGADLVVVWLPKRLAAPVAVRTKI